MKKIVLAILSLSGSLGISAQSMSVEEYINTYKDIAISEMKRVGIPASITIAQGILETENGNSDLVKRSNNHFGIKCKNTWTGESVFHDDDARGECFRKYNNATESYRDHSDFLRNSSRYAFLFELDPGDYKGWAYGLKKAGYATNPRYPAILIRNIEDYNLTQYDNGFTGNVTIAAPREKTETVAVKEVNDKLPAGLDAMNTDKNLSSIKAGKTLFNSLKAVYVPRGTSLLAIATRFDIPLARLLEFNDLKTDGLLQEEQWIFLERKLKSGNRDYHITEKGETLYSIAQINAIQLEYLLRYNDGLNENAVFKPGTKVRLRPATDKAAVRGTSPGTFIHEVQPKEGLYSISKKYNITVADLKSINNLSADDLVVGQQLRISK